MIEKKPLDDGSGVEVTFVVPASQTAGDASIAGDFNGWDLTATPLVKSGDRRVATVTLQAGRRYAFRYFSGGQWFNDEAADAYEPNEFEGHNGAVDLTATGSSRPATPTA